MRLSTNTEETNRSNGAQQKHDMNVNLELEEYITEFVAGEIWSRPRRVWMCDVRLQVVHTVQNPSSHPNPGSIADPLDRQRLGILWTH